MSRSTLVATAALGTALTLGAVGIGTAVLPGVAGAQTDPASSSASAPASVGATEGTDGVASRLARHPRLRHLLREEGQVAADTIGVSPSDLRDALRDGQSIAEVAQAHGVDPQTVVDAVVGDLSAKVDAAVQDGRLTQERADRITSRLPARVEALVDRHRP